MKITGAELLVKALKEEKVRTLFAYPGGQAIDLFNALYGEKESDVILPRHEQGLLQQIMIVCRWYVLRAKFRQILSAMIPFKKWIRLALQRVYANMQ